MSQMQTPPGGYVPTPQIRADDFRHEHELVAGLGSVAIAVLILLVFGALFNALAALLIPVVLSIVGIYVANVTNKGHMVQVTQNQFPELHRTSQEIAWRLNMPLPNLYIKQSPILNGYAVGLIGSGTVVLHSALLDQMTHEEVATVIAHEFGHIKCGHTFYLILQQMTVGGIMGNVLFTPLRWLFFYSSRMKEYSADRAALIGTLNLQACITSEIKLSVGAHLFQKMNIQAYLQQIDDFNQQTGSKLVEFLNDSTHPLTVNRIQALIRFYRSPKYQQLAGLFGRSGTTTLTAGAVGTRDLFHRVAARAEYDRNLQQMQGAASGSTAGSSQPANALQGPTSHCSTCGVPLESYAKFCARCGTPVAGVGAPPVVQAAPATQPAPSHAIPAAPATPDFQRIERSPADGQGPRVVRRVTAPPPASQPVSQPPTPPVAQSAPQPIQPAQVQPPAPQQAVRPTTCPSCQQPVPPEGKFCGQCGHAIGG